MRAHEFIFEVKAGKIKKSAQQSSRGINTYGDQERINGDYVGFKLPEYISIRPVLIHINGVEKNVYSSGFFASIIDFSEMLYPG